MVAFKDCKLGTKIGGGFLFLILLAGMVSVVGWTGMRQMVDRVEKADDTTRMIQMILQSRRHEKNFILRNDLKYVENVKKEIGDLKKAALETKNKFQDPVNRAQMDKVLAAADQYEGAFGRVVELAGKNAGQRVDQAGEFPALDQVLIQTGRTVEQECHEARLNQKQKMEHQMNRAKTLMAAGALAALLLGSLVAFLITRGITRPVRRVIESLVEGSAQVAGAAREVSAASQSLAAGASEQAAGLEQTSASMEEMSSITKQNADHAREAKTMMGEVQQIVQKVNAHMDQMGQAINEITRSSEETEKIIKTIDEIAFQTNLLALNAAVEAARAGEAGAGFAVVADEVRNLALRAAQAAKNTSGLIENTIGAIRRGNKLTRATREAFEENTAVAGRISRLIDDIAGASQEQAQGIAEVGQAISEMDRIVQQNAAASEESAAASEELNAQSEQMRDLVRELQILVEGLGRERGPVAAAGRPEADPRRLLENAG